MLQMLLFDGLSLGIREFVQIKVSALYIEVDELKPFSKIWNQITNLTLHISTKYT
jgi:hypothetical protein